MKKWSIAFLASLILNFLLFAGGAFYMMWFNAPTDHETTPLEIEFASAEDSSSAEAPKVAPPAPKKVDIPAPLTSEQVQAVKEGVPLEQVDPKLVTPTSAPTPNLNTTSTDGNPTTTGNPNQNNTGNETVPNRVGQPGENHGPRAISYYKPTLPNSLKNTGFTGRTTIGFHIDETGAVSNVWIIESSGNSVADDAMVSTAYGWSFEPAMEDGVPYGVDKETFVDWGL